MRTEVAALLIDIEARLRQLGLWDEVAPSAAALASTEPFCIDTLSFPQWLQFIFLPTMHRLLATDLPLPERCGIAPMAEEFFQTAGLSGTSLIDALLQMDTLLSLAGDGY